ncbi:ribokinase-like protein [Rhexocercosporidium sp. MPI-PUGE-AT-0058]|nr:ribokinase-like protein [Rhexocercosporidium sp. MPI-PUGE-AT-0058]
MSPKSITVIGSLNTDLVSVTARVPSGGETLTGTSFHTGAGGKGANQAVAAARMSRANPHKSSATTSERPDGENTDVDIVVKMVGAVGNDEFGPKLIAGMKEDGIDVSGIEVVEEQPTGVAVIIVESTTGENRILLNPGANSTLLPTSFLPLPSPSPNSHSHFNPPPSLLILQLEIPLPTLLQIITTASLTQPPTPILLNPAPAVPLPESIYPSITHLILNESEAALLTNRTVEEVEEQDFQWANVAGEFIGRGVRNVVITLGSKGAFWASSSTGTGFSTANTPIWKSGFVPALKVDKVVDTTAAGDTFVGAYAVAVVRAGTSTGTGGGGEGEGLDLESVVRWACKASARTVQKEGAQSSIPWADEV